MNPKVDGYFKKAKKWRAELEKLRNIILDCELTEELKWGKPCYTLKGSNVVIILPLKETCGLLFSKGALLKDPKNILIQPTENTQAARQIRFTSLQEINKMAPVLKTYLQDAIKVEKAGLEVTYKKISDWKVPDEFQKQLDNKPALKTAFTSLTPGRQRGYLLYFSGAKQSKTRETRVAKCLPQILKRKGLDDD